MNKLRKKRASDKIQLSLEKNQATTLLVGSLISMGLVFLMGVILGSRLSDVEEMKEVQEIAVETAPEQQPRAASESTELTFHRELTSGRKGSGESNSGNGASGSRAKAAPVAATVSATERSPVARNPQVSESRNRPGTVSSASNSQSARNNESFFTVQVSSSRNEADTIRLSDRLRAAGYDSRVVATDIEGRGRWYRVRVGRFETREEAAGRQAEIHGAFNLPGLVVNEQP